MMQSAGTLLYRKTSSGIEVLLVHPAGAYNRMAPWSIPKGIPDPNESLVETALRETEEETGIRPLILAGLGSIEYSRSRKRVVAFAGQAPNGSEPRCASWEVDRAEFMAIDEAFKRLHPDQRPFLDRLLAILDESTTRP